MRLNKKICDSFHQNVKNISVDFDRNITSIFWSGNSNKIFFKYDDFGMTKLGYFNLSGEFKFLVSEVGGLSQGRPYSGGSYSISRNDRYVQRYFQFNGQNFHLVSNTIFRECCLCLYDVEF